MVTFVPAPPDSVTWAVQVLRRTSPVGATVFPHLRFFFQFFFRFCLLCPWRQIVWCSLRCVWYTRWITQARFFFSPPFFLFFSPFRVPEIVQMGSLDWSSRCLPRRFIFYPPHLAVHPPLLFSSLLTALSPPALVFHMVNNVTSGPGKAGYNDFAVLKSTATHFSSFPRTDPR